MIIRHSLIAPCLLLLLMVQLSPIAKAAPDLGSRNNFNVGISANVTATNDAWAAVAERAWYAGTYDRAAPKDFFEENPYRAQVLVTGQWDGSLVTTHVIETQLPEKQVFGESLGLMGNRLAVGAPSEGASKILSCGDYFCLVGWDMRDPGQVYLYQYDGATFALERSISRGDELARFGHALALEQTQLLVGAPGAAMAYLFNADTGAELEAFSSPAPGGNDEFGAVVALSDTVAAITAIASDTVYIFQNGVAGWALLAELTHPGEESEFGAALAADNDRVLIGAPGIDKAFLYELADLEEGLVVPASSSDWPAAEEFSGASDSAYGAAVALLNNSAWISAPSEFIDGKSHGLVRQYDYATGSGWTLADTLRDAAFPARWDDFGKAIAVSSQLLSVASPQTQQQDVFTAPSNVYDTDGDAISQFADNCPNTANADQGDVDLDGTGDACDDDIDDDNLTNEEEALLGTDPRKPDTDGDGLQDDRDPVPLHKDIDGDDLEDPDDNCPQDANPLQENADGDRWGDACDDDNDNDSLSNEDEIAGGTDPFNKDSDGDGYEDDYDLFPTDENDGWSKVYRFPLYQAEYVAVDGNLALAANNNWDIQAYARAGEQWEEISAPDLAALNARRIEGLALSGTVAAIIVKEYQYSQLGDNRPAILIYHWNPQSGWVFVQDIKPPIYRHNIDEIRLNGNLMAVVGGHVSGATGEGRVETYRGIFGVFQATGTYLGDGPAYQLEAAISGDRVFVGDDIIFSNDPTTLFALSANGDVEASIFTSIKDSTSNSSCSNPSNSPLMSAGNGKLLLSTEGSDFWVQQSEPGGSLQLQAVAVGNNNIAGLGNENLIGLEHPIPLTHPITGEQTDYNLKVLSMVDGQDLGHIPNRTNFLCWLKWDTDGQAVITASDSFVEIYPIDRDGDGVADSIDNCRSTANPGQEDTDGDGTGDSCELVVPPGC